MEENRWGTEQAELPFHVQKVSNLTRFVPVPTGLIPLNVLNHPAPARSDVSTMLEV